MDDEKLIALITRLVLDELRGEQSVSEHSQTLSGAGKGTDPREVVIGVGPAFQTKIHATINNLPLVDVLRELEAGIEEEGMTYRVIKVFKTADVSFIGKEAAEMSGSGISIGLQSKGTAIIHQKDLHPLTNLELFPQAPLMTLAHYRRVGRNAAKYVKGENVTPIEVMNDPMVRAKYQVKAALLHIKETEETDTARSSVVWAPNNEKHREAQ